MPTIEVTDTNVGSTVNTTPKGHFKTFSDSYKPVIVRKRIDEDQLATM